jgi:glycosyltransferase involved in cell wall biosynthesis
MKISIVIPYYQRLEQLQKTLASIAKSFITDYNIVIVDDASPSPLIIDNDRIHIIRLLPEDKKWKQQDVAANTGFYYAMQAFRPDAVIIQSPECYHEGDVLKYVSDNLTDISYITMACYSINKENTDNPLLDIWGVVSQNNHIVGADMQNGWYNHPVHRPVNYEFCAAITTTNLIKLNGYDERLSEGIAFNDDYFLYRIKLMGLFPVIATDVIVVHQWHQTSEAHNNSALIERNRTIYNNLVQKREIKATHLFTPNL